MEITLTEQLQRFVAKKVKDGTYASRSEVVAEALRQLGKSEAAGGSGEAGDDIEALAFRVMMQATQDANQDLKTIMGEIQAMNKAKQQMREMIQKIKHDISANCRKKGEIDPLDLKTGMGSERAYHRAMIPCPDPLAKGGVTLVPTNLYPGKVKDVCQLQDIRDDLMSRLDSMGDISEMMTLRLQMAMDRRSKMMSTLSNIMKKISDTAEAITQNLK